STDRVEELARPRAGRPRAAGIPDLARAARRDPVPYIVVVRVRGRENVVGSPRLTLIAAGLAALRLLLESLPGIELLLAGREDEPLAAVDAGELAIDELHESSGGIKGGARTKIP